MSDLATRAGRIRLSQTEIARRAKLDKNTVTKVMSGKAHLSTSAEAVRRVIHAEEQSLWAYLNGQAEAAE